MFCQIKLHSYDDGPFKYGAFVQVKVGQTMYSALCLDDNWEGAVYRGISQCLIKAHRPDVDVRDLWAMSDVQGELL